MHHKVAFNPILPEHGLYLLAYGTCGSERSIILNSNIELLTFFFFYSRAEDAVIIENKIQSLIQIEEPQSTKGEIESDVQSIQEPLPIKSVEDLENQHTILPINKGEKKYMEESLKQGIDKGNDLLTDDNNMSNNSRYICHANQDVETVTTSSSGDDPTCKFVANHSNLQMKPPTDLAGRCQNNTYMFDELDLLGKNHTEVTSISVIAEEKKMKNHSKLEDKITNISFDLTEKITDHFLQTEKIHQTNSCGIQHKANENDYIIKQQLGGNAALKSDMSCTETVSEIYMEPQENHTCSNINTENLKPFHERKKDSNKEDDLNFGPTSNDHLVECLFDQSEVSELKVKQEVNNPGMPSADIHEADIIHPDDRQSKDITDSQLCDVDWMSQFPEEIR